MTKANLRLFLLAGTTAATAVSGSLVQSGAQTATTHHPTTAHPATAHRTTAASHRPVVKSECVTLPTFSPKIPALPLGSPCPKSLITVDVEEKVDLSPMIGPAIREVFKSASTKFTLAYVDEVVGTGVPAAQHMYYTVRYAGYLPDGTKFDASADHPGGKPLSFPYGAHRVIPGWDIGFEGMHLGGKRRLYIPWQLAYGERGRPPIPPKSDLIFDMELISQSPTDPDAPPPAPPTPPAGPGSPSANPILGNPPTVNPNSAAPGSGPGSAPGSAPSSTPGSNPGVQTPPSARPQTGPDTKPAPSPTGVPNSPSNTTPPTAKQPPQGNL